MFSGTARRERGEAAQQEQLLETLLENVWGFSKDHSRINSQSRSARAYREHCWGAFQNEVNTPETSDVLNLTKIVEKNLAQKWDAVVTSIIEKKPQWIGGALDHRARAASALAGIVKLLLFTGIVVDSGDLTVGQLIEKSLPKKTDQIKGEISEDLSATNLIRVAGLEIDWTSDLSDHLVTQGRRVRFFRHAAVVERLEDSHSKLFPSGFLAEVNRSICLFFPPEDWKSRRRMRKIERKQWVDLEARLQADLPERILESYPYYGERLRVIQAKYDASKPRNLKQFWFDRRRPIEWLGLNTAIVSFIITAIFTIVSAVTGILQVLKKGG